MKKSTVITAWVTALLLAGFVGLIKWIDWSTNHHRFWYIYGTRIGLGMMIGGIIISVIWGIIVTIKYFYDQTKEDKK